MMKVFGTNTTKGQIQNNKKSATNTRKTKRKGRFSKATAVEYSQLGDEALRNKDFTTAVKHYWHSISLIAPVDEENSYIQDLVQCKKNCVAVSTLLKISEVHRKENKIDESQSTLERAESLIRSVLMFENQQENNASTDYDAVQYSALTLHSKVLEAKGDLEVSKGQITSAEEIYLAALARKRSALNIIRSHPTVAALFSTHQSIDIEMAVVLKKLGRVLQRRGNYKESMLTYSEALSVRIEHQQDSTVTEVAQLLQTLSEICRELGDYPSALQHLKVLEQSFKKRASRATLVNVLIEKSNILILQEKYTLSMHAATSALEIANGDGFEHSEGPLPRASATEQVAKVLEAELKYDDAILWHKKAHAIRSSVLSESHPLVLQSAKHMAQIYCKRGEVDRAKNLFKEIRDKIIKAYGSEEHARVADVLDDIGSLYTDQRNVSTAIKYHKRAMEIRRACSANLGIDGAETLGHIACLELDSGDRNDAMKHFSEALDILRKNHCCSSHPLVVKTIRNMTSFDHVEDELESISVKI